MQLSDSIPNKNDHFKGKYRTYFFYFLNCFRFLFSEIQILHKNYETYYFFWKPQLTFLFTFTSFWISIDAELYKQFNTKVSVEKINSFQIRIKNISKMNLLVNLRKILSAITSRHSVFSTFSNMFPSPIPNFKIYPYPIRLSE